MRIFIDTNILLGYFSENADISSLEELLKLVKERKIALFHTKQLENEFLREVSSRTEQTRKSILKACSSVKCDLPEKTDSSLRDKLQKKIDSMNSLMESEQKKRLKKYSAKTKNTERIICRIFKLSECQDYTSEIIERAKLRHFKGNPPKKKNDNSFGDAINWELILEYASDDNLTIVSRDQDFTEKIEDEVTLNKILSKEWSEKTDKELKLSPALGSLINKTEKKKVIPDTTVETEEASPSYTDTVHYYTYQDSGSPHELTTWTQMLDNMTLTSYNNPEELLHVNFHQELPRVKYCPYCGSKDPFATGIRPITNVQIGYKCKHCGKHISL